MTNGRFGSYTSFFSECIANTTSSVAQLVSVKNTVDIKSSVTHQYAKCQSGLKELVTSSAVTQIKNNLGNCTQKALNGYEKAKTSVSEVIKSEPVQGVATSLKEGAIVGSNKFKRTITQAIGHEKVERVHQQCDKYTESIADNYHFTKDKLDKFMGSPEILRIKSIFDGSMNAVLSTNFLFDLGAKFIPGADASTALQSSKYLVACIIFAISAYQSFEIRKQDYTTHEHVGLYQRQVEEAYDVASQLQKVFSNIEALLQANYGHGMELSSVSSKDFEAVGNEFLQQTYNIDYNLFIKALLDGATKTSWVQYLIKVISLSLPIMGSFSVFFVTAALVYTTLSALRKYQLRADDEANIDLLQHQLEPIYAMLQNLEKKLYADPEFNQSSLDHKIKSSLTNISNESSFNVDLNAVTEGVAKTSGLYVILQSLLHGYSHFNYIIYLGILCFEIYELHASKQKQENLEQSFNNLAIRMGKLPEMIEKMKSLLVKQENYEKYLEESNQAREEFRKVTEAYKLEMLKKAEEERYHEELRTLEEARQEEQRKIELLRQEEIKKLEEMRKEMARDDEIKQFEARQKEFRKIELLRQAEFKSFELERHEESKNLEAGAPREEMQIEESYIPQVHIEEKSLMSRESKIDLDARIIEIQQHSFIADLKLHEKEQDAKPVNPTAKPKYFPAMLGGVMGVGIGWLLGVCVSTLLAVPTLGLSLVVPAVCAFIGGIIGFGLAYWASNSSGTDPLSTKKHDNIRNNELSTRHTRKKVSTLFCRRVDPNFSESSSSSSQPKPCHANMTL